MHSCLLESGLSRSLPPLPPSPAPPCLPCIEGRQRATPHSSFPPTTTPLQTLHMDYAAHQLNLWPRVSLPETSPTLRWTGKVGDASVFRVWGSRAFVFDPSADKLTACAIPCVFFGFVLDTPGWQFYHPTLRRVLPSQDVTIDELVPFYHLFPYHSAPLPPPPLFLAPGPPPVDPLSPQAVDSSAARGTASGGAELGGAGPGGVESGGAETRGAEPGGNEIGGAVPGGAELEGVEPGGAASEGAESGGAEPQGAASSGGSCGASSRLSPQELPGGGGVAAGAGVTRGTAATSPGGARMRCTGAAGIGGVGGARARDSTESGAACAGGSGAGTGAGGAGAKGAGAGGAGAVDPGGAVRPRPYFVPLLQQVLGTPSSTGLTPPLLCPPPDLSRPPLQPASPLPAPSPYTEQSDRACVVGPTVSRLLATADTDPSCESAAASALVAELLDFAVACCLDYASALVAESACASPPSVGGECALGTDVLEDKQEDFECRAAAVPCFASILLAPEGDPDAPDIPTLRFCAKAITGPYSSQWQAAMDAEMTSWKSKSTYVDEVSPPGANIVDGMWIFRVKRPSGSPPAFKARYLARGFCQRTGVNYFQTFSPTQKMTTLWVLQRFCFLFSSPQTTPLSTSHSLSAPPLDESVELSGPYTELVGCLIMWGMGLVLGGRGPVVLTGHADAFWVDDSAMQQSSQGYTFNLGSGSVSWRSTRSSLVLSSSSEAEIYAGAMAAQELRWLTYLLNDLGEQPCLPPVL
ncbi:unnamed protein product [Closterium sp. NIES-54]